MPWLSSHTLNALRATLACTVVLFGAPGWAGDGRYRVIHAFASSAQSGPPSGGLMQASDGFLYGQTTRTHIYRLSLAGEFTPLRSSNLELGGLPPGPLMEGQDGTFFGTWNLGVVRNGRGLVFSFKPGTGISILHQFTWSQRLPGDGAYPRSGLLRADDGWMYGITSGGGDHAHHSGALYRINTSGQLQIRHLFSRAQHGELAFTPLASLTSDDQGGLLGTATDGGSHGDGGIFRMDAAGDVHAVYNFRLNREGGRPMTGPLRAKNGSFWGTTSQGGPLGCGTVYQLRPAAHLRVVHHFDPGIAGPCPKVTQPELAVATPTLSTADGKVFYGTAPYGGQHGWGVVFKLRANGEYTVLHDFGEQGIDGRQPNSPPVLANDGFLYGTTLLGGADDLGTIYRVRP